MNWKFFVKMALPFLRQAGMDKKEEDTNNSGKDDIIGGALVYAADLLDAILRGKELPKVPTELK